MTTAPQSPEPRKTITLLHKGACLLAAKSGGEKIGYEYIQLTGPISHNLATTPTAEKSKVYEPRLLKWDQTGAVLTIEATPDGNSVYPSTAKFVKRWPNEDELLQWQTRSRALQDEKAAEREAKNLMSRQDLDTVLLPLRDLYSRVRTSVTRRLILAQVIESITRREP